jgi:hypothetical protein
MTTFGGSTVPPLFVNTFGGGGTIDITVQNSGGNGIFMFGGWMFPINGTSAFDRGTISAATRDDAGDVYHFSDDFRPTDPPDYTFQTIFTSKSEPWDVNDNNFGQSSNCFNISNGCRITKGAGVAVVFSCFIEVLVNISLVGSNTCPGGGGPSQGGTFFQKQYNLVATFTG